MAHSVSREELDRTYRIVPTDDFFVGTVWTVNYNSEDDHDIQKGFDLVYVYNRNTRTKLKPRLVWSRSW